MKKQAVIYARQSSGDDDYSESVEVQIANCRNLAEREHLEITEVLFDLNISGKTYPAGWEALANADGAFQRWLKESRNPRRISRPGLGRVMELAERVDYIIVDDVTRLYRPLSRSFLESAVNEYLISVKVQILQVKGGKLDLAQFDQQLVTMLKNQINDEQIAKQRQRSIEVLNKIRDSGFMPTGITAFALNYNKFIKRYTVDPEKSAVVRFIFDQVLAGKSCSSIVKSVNRRWQNLFGGCFWEKTFYSILRKPIYAGYQYNTSGELIKNHQGEALIPLTTFLAAQQMIAQKRLQSLSNQNNTPCKHWMPLSGKLYCGNCGSRLVCAIESGKIVYVCRRGSLRGDPACRGSRISMRCSKPYLNGLIDAVQAALGNILLDKQIKLLAGDERGGKISGIAENNNTASYEERLEHISLEFSRGNLPPAVFHRALAELNDNMSRARQQLRRQDELSATAVLQKELDRLVENYMNNSLSQVEFESLLQTKTVKVIVYDQMVEITVGSEKFEFARRTVCRQKGVSAHMVGKLRNRFLKLINSQKSDF